MTINCICSWIVLVSTKSTQYLVIRVRVLFAILRIVNTSSTESHSHNNSGRQDTDNILEIKMWCNLTNNPNAEIKLTY